MSQKRRNAITLFCIIVLALVFASCPQSGRAGILQNGVNRVSLVNGVSVEVLVADSVSGSAVDGTELKVFYSKTKSLAAQVDIKNGKGYVNLIPNQTYDFELLGKKGVRAGSVIYDYFIGGGQSLTMLQFQHGQITRGIETPKITAVKADSETGADITENTEIDGKINKIYVEFTSSVGAVEEVAWNGYGAKLSIGGSPGSSTGISGEYTPDTVSDNIFISKYKFDIRDVKLPDGETELVIVGYDVANNRVEKHIPVRFKKGFNANPLANAQFKNPFIIVERVPFSNNTFSANGDIQIETLKTASDFTAPAVLDPYNGESSSYRAIVVFDIVDKTSGKTKIPISGFDLYRRDMGSIGEFKFVSRTLYDKPKVETGAGWGLHQGFDNSSELKENGEYEYKIKAFNEAGTIESPVMAGKLMEAFTYTLETPINRKEIPLSLAADIAYSCKISNPGLLTEQAADWCDLGLLILDGQGQPLFGSKLRYVFDSGDGTPDILVDTAEGTPKPVRRSYKQHLKSKLQSLGINNLEDIVKLDAGSGIITFTHKFMKIPYFNVAASGAMEYKAGVNYQWDIQDWGESPYRLTDDRALRIVKMYGGAQSRTMGNNSPSGSNAVNGRFTFTVTE
ncbi:dentilisin complex subunit PrcA [Treponema pedis]|uniref:dentilisin complex subunit PrcA n=1 Tax=Treponema pedis TaxID=409322 RepID=UPI000404F44F|nr:dentilisin complex subunit PrcA [Treponema pedis]